MKNMSRAVKATGKANSKLVAKLPRGPIPLVRFPFFSPLFTVFVLTSHHIPSFPETGADYPQFGVLCG
jgi:hypothetical protein